MLDGLKTSFQVTDDAFYKSWTLPNF